MRLTVLRFMGQPVTEALSARFDEQGGSIGRDASCTLHLPDPYKHISRVQAEVAAHQGVFVLTDRGSSNPVIKGGQEIGRNRQVLLADGDLLTIGDYEVSVSMNDTAVAQPPAGLAGAYPPAAVAGLPPVPDAFEAIPPTQFWHNLTGTSGVSGQDPFAQLVQSAPPPAVASGSPYSVAPGEGATVIPPDFDPFAPDALPDDHKLDVLGPDSGRAGAPFGGLADPLGPASGQHRVAREEALDQLFDLGGASANPLGSNSPLGDPLLAPNTASAQDPLLALSLGKTPLVAPVADHTPEVNSSFMVPEGRVAATFLHPSAQPLAPVSAQPLPSPEAGPPPAVAQPAAPAPLPAAGVGAFRSWDHPEHHLGAATLGVAGPDSSAQPAGPLASPPGVPFVPAAPELFPAAAASDSPSQADPAPAILHDAYAGIVDAAVGAHRGDFQPFPKTRPTERIEAMNQAALAAAAAAGLPQPQDQIDALTNALLAGLGLTAIPRGMDNNPANAGLTPELMRKLGALLRISMQGSLDLLSARAMLKKELRSEMTMIVSSNNNPMKFSPDATAALAQMLAPRTLRGFMDAVPAMQDTYNDLMAHQVGFVAGMRAAMQGLIERFNPEQLEARLSKPNVLNTVLPMSRKARLWELFSELYGEISREAEDDFEALFGRAFVQAYEEQINRLDGVSASGSPRDRG